LYIVIFLLYNYNGWYKRSFDYAKGKKPNRVFVYFEASNYQTDVYLNGKKLGVHIGGFTPFYFEITDLLKESDNFLVVKVDNKRKKEGVPTLNTDWWNYGGITRDVKLIETSNTFIEDYFIQLDPDNNKRIMGELTLNGNNKNQKKIQISIPELNIEKSFDTDENGKFAIEITSYKIKYWSLENPYLYDVIIKTEEDKITDQIGFRTIRTKGSQILLNGQPIFLKGNFYSRRKSDKWWKRAFYRRCPTIIKMDTGLGVQLHPFGSLST